MNLQFRKMQHQDIAEVYRIECDLFQDPWSYDSFERDVEDEQIARAFVVEYENEIAGYAICWNYSSEIHIGNIAVTRKWQRQGIGAFILSKLLEYFKDVEISYLEVREHNQPAISLYQKFGFETTYVRKGYYPDGENALVMVKKIINRGQNGLV
jgi:ribosomal-protein-alanine N-acetyltransferase